jgi:hypothetical protein
LSKPFAVTEVYVWVTTDPKTGDEGVAIAHDPHTHFDSVIGSANLGIASSLKPFIEAIEQKSGYKGRLVRFVIDTTVDKDLVNEFAKLGEDEAHQTH